MSKPRIGLSPCIFPKDPVRPLFKGKALIYMEQSMGHWLSRNGGLTYLIPPHLDESNLQEFVDDIDGLLLQGGTDVAPQNYGETPLKPEWGGDSARDEVEIALTKACHKKGVPILAVCRGIQIMNVAFGGTLYQDINTQIEGSLVHRDWDIYDQNFHAVDLDKGSNISKIYGETSTGEINSVHHQSIKDVADGLVVTARCPDDGVIEAIEYPGSQSYVMAVQWHPEFQDPANKTLLDPDLIAKDFIKAASAYQQERS